MAVGYSPLPRLSSDSYSSDDPLRPAYTPPRRRRFPSPLHLLRRSRRACRPIYLLIGFLAFFVWQIVFNASYAHPRAFTIPPDETVFIAANIVNGELITGAWGESLLELVELIGKDKVYVSIYGGPSAALKDLEQRLPCGKTILSESDNPLNTSTIQHITLASGQKKVKRIAYLAAVRNKALAPLSTLHTQYTRVLFLNDVHFHAQDAARLLWGTNVNSEGKPEYKAACGADFIATWKYYDTFATRDLEGYSLGVPLFPWFSREGEHVSRSDVLAGRDNVRVKSCWGGIVAFDGRYFQPNSSAALPLSFRSELEPFWDASECCLIHADILSLPPFPPFSSNGTGIFLNPYVRVAYDAWTLKHMPLIQRFERLFSLPQAIVNYFAKMPRFNYRRTENEGDVVRDREWVANPYEQVEADPKTQFGSEDTWQGSGVGRRAIVGNLHGQGREYWAKKGKYVDVERVAGRGGYCGTRQLLIWREEGYGESQGGSSKAGGLDDEGKNWDKYMDEVPPIEEER